LLSTPHSADRIELSGLSTAGSELRFLELAITDVHGKSLPSIRVMQPFRVVVTFEAVRSLDRLIIGVGVHDHTNFPLLATHTNDYGEMCQVSSGVWSVSAEISPNYLREGEYVLSLGAIAESSALAHIPRACTFTIEPVVHDPGSYYDQRIGAFFIPMQWSKPERVGSRSRGEALPQSSGVQG
jgi:hypothetical protein